MLAKSGIIVNLGWHFGLLEEMIAKAIKTLVVNRELRFSMSNRAMKLIDGEGVDRVVMHLCQEDFYLRQAKEDDCGLLFQWVNEPAVRNASFNSNAIDWAEHCQWFRRKIEDPSCIIFVATDEAEQPLGMARFEIEGKEATISISLDARFRRQRLGTKLVAKASQKIMTLKNLDRIKAYIKIENTASFHAFWNAGYRNPVKIKVRDYPAYQMIYSKGR